MKIDLKIDLEINNIYSDYDKWNILIVNINKIDFKLLSLKYMWNEYVKNISNWTNLNHINLKYKQNWKKNRETLFLLTIIFQVCIAKIRQLNKLIIKKILWEKNNNL